MKVSLRERLLSPGGLAAIFVALFPFVYFFPAMTGRLVLAPDDALIFGLPLRVAAAQMLREGHLPLWNPYLFSGMPLFASAQAGVLFPLNWFFLIVGPRAAMNLAVLGAYSTAALGAFFYARRTGVNIAGALTTAIIWQCCGFFVAQVGHLNVIHVAALLPWLIWSIDGYGATGERKRGALIAIIVALQVFAGHQQTLVYSLVLASGYALFVGLTNPAQRRAYLQSLVFIVTGLLLGAVQILPTIELLRESIRSAATYDFFTSFSLPPVFLLTFFAPYLVGGGDGSLFRAPYLSEAFYGEYVGYVGVIGVTLALIAPFVRQDRLTKFWATAAIAALALALGRVWPFDLYRLVYHIPVLNLFRVPARHMMEVDFALAVLAGRAVAFLSRFNIPASRDGAGPPSGRRIPARAQLNLRREGAPAPEKRRFAIVIGISVGVLVLTWASVTIFRPSEFRLGRIGPVSILRAPELFLPLVMAAASGWTLLRFTRSQRFATFALVSLLLFDLCLWGQFSGWRAGSPRRDHPIFHKPAVAKFLRYEKGIAPGKDRVLTLEKPFGDMATNAAPPFDVALQPDTYMMHRIENAAGYDGFGLARYSRLTGDMKVWGAFPDTAKSVLESRALDLLNVRYLIAPSRQAGASQFLPVSAKLGDLAFSDRDLGLAFLESGMRFDFETPDVHANRIALVTNLAWSSNLADGTNAAVITLRAKDGRSWHFDFRVGLDSSEWAYDRPDIRATIRHSRARIGLSSDAGGFEAHNFVTSFALPENAIIAGGSIEVARVAESPNFGLSVQRVSLVDETRGATVALRKEWFSDKRSSNTENPDNGLAGWVRVKRIGKVDLYENREALPPVWLASEARALPDKAKLEVIQTGKFPEGELWDPLRTVLLNKLPNLPAPPFPPNDQHAEIVRYQPNAVEIATASSAASILVLSDNHYPGWKVTVDGKRAALLRADYNLRGVLLETGSHRIRFSYQPRSVVQGLLVSVVSGIGLAGWCGIRRPRRTG